MLKNVTLSAEESMLRAARERAQREKTTLNGAFRVWLTRYASIPGSARDYRRLMSRLGYATPGRRFSREEMNER